MKEVEKMQDLEKRLNDLESRVTKLEQGETSVSQIHSDSILPKLANKFGEISPQNIVTIALKIKPGQTKKQLISLIEGWGTPIKKWFSTNHFKERLLDKGLVIIVGKNDKGKEIFSLSQVKGIKNADNLIQKYSE